MKPEVPERLLEAAKQWSELHRWERSELGKALRRFGSSYRALQIPVPVPKGTLSRWCQEVTLTSAQIAAIKNRVASQEGVPKDS